MQSCRVNQVNPAGRIPSRIGGGGPAPPAEHVLPKHFGRRSKQPAVMDVGGHHDRPWIRDVSTIRLLGDDPLKIALAKCRVELPPRCRGAHRDRSSGHTAASRPSSICARQSKYHASRPRSRVRPARGEMPKADRWNCRRVAARSAPRPGRPAPRRESRSMRSERASDGESRRAFAVHERQQIPIASHQRSDRVVSCHQPDSDHQGASIADQTAERGRPAAQPPAARARPRR